jgi:hypothetical protein
MCILSFLYLSKFLSLSLYFLSLVFSSLFSCSYLFLGILCSSGWLNWSSAEVTSCANGQVTHRVTNYSLASLTEIRFVVSLFPSLSLSLSLSLEFFRFSPFVDMRNGSDDVPLLCSSLFSSSSSSLFLFLFLFLFFSLSLTGTKKGSPAIKDPFTSINETRKETA